MAQRLLLLLYLAGDPPGVAFLLSVNPRRDRSRFPFVFAAKKRIFRPGDEATSCPRPTLGIMESVRFFFLRMLVSVGSSGEFLVGVVCM